MENMEKTPTWWTTCDLQLLQASLLDPHSGLGAVLGPHCDQVLLNPPRSMTP